MNMKIKNIRTLPVYLISGSFRTSAQRFWINSEIKQPRSMMTRNNENKDFSHVCGKNRLSIIVRNDNSGKLKLAKFFVKFRLFSEKCPDNMRFRGTSQDLLFRQSHTKYEHGKSPHGSGGFDFWVVPNQRSAVLDKLGNQRIRNHMKSDATTFCIIYIMAIKKDGLLICSPESRRRRKLGRRQM